MAIDDLGAHLAGDILRCIPTHREPRMTITQIAMRAGLLLNPSEALAATQAAVAVLRAFGVLDESEEGLRAGGQVPAYFLRSLEWFVRNRAPMLDGWHDQNTQFPTDDATMSGVQFLCQIERRRLVLAESLGIEAVASREQAAVVVLVKAMIGRRPHLLFQWDARARRMQLIGGRIEPGETPAQAALREFREEVGDVQLPRWQHGRDYEIAPRSMRGGILALTQLSPTYGALTAYTFHAFAAHIQAAHFTLNAGMHWLNRDEMLRGQTRAGVSLGDPALYRLLLARLVGGIRSVPASFTLQMREHFVGVGE